jgi:hypothetical protein
VSFGVRQHSPAADPTVVDLTQRLDPGSMTRSRATLSYQSVNGRGHLADCLALPMQGTAEDGLDEFLDERIP